MGLERIKALRIARRMKRIANTVNLDRYPVRLNIGAGKTWLPGFRNIDISEKAEIVLDLNTEKLPFEDNSVDLIYTYHLLEHVHNYLGLIVEMHRVLKPGGLLLVGVPYVTSTRFNLVNPYHVNHFNEHSFDFFDSTRLKGSAEEGGVAEFRTVGVRYHYFSWFRWLPFRSIARRHLFNIVSSLDFAIIKADENDRSAPQLEEDWRALFDVISHSRISYELRNEGAREGSAFGEHQP